MKSIWIIALILTTLNNTVCGSNAQASGSFGAHIKEFTIALYQNADGVQKLHDTILNEISNPNSANYGSYLSPEEIGRMVGAPESDRAKVTRHMENNDFDCVDNYDAIKCSGPITTIDRVFKTQTKRFDYPSGGYVMTSIVPYTVPRNLPVVFIDGLCNSPYALHDSNHKRFRFSMNSASNVDPGMVTREVVSRMYGLYPTFSGSNVSVCAVEFFASKYGDGFSNRSLIADQKANGVPANPIPPERTIGNLRNPDTESSLDVQTMYWAASDAELWYETTDMWMYQWANDFANRRFNPEVVSLSWGWSELDQCTLVECLNETSKQYVTRANVEFSKIVARGTTIVVAAGDAGSPGRTNEGCGSSMNDGYWNHVNPVFPGGSPWVLSVGATYVTQSDNSVEYQTQVCTGNNRCAVGVDEAGTTFSETGWTSGSGFTHWDVTPSWQSAQVKSYISSGVRLPDSKYFNAKGRAYPDIAGFGHNCLIYMGGAFQPVDGTSCASPVIAGGIANLNAFQKSRGKPILGFANPLIYKAFSDSPSAFYDVTRGNSACTEMTCCNHQFGFEATKGWDPISGVGTPNFEALKRWLVHNT